jgi:hypothetical protein
MEIVKEFEQWLFSKQTAALSRVSTPNHDKEIEAGSCTVALALLREFIETRRK